MVRLWDYEDEIRSGNLPEFAPLLPLVSKRKDKEVLWKTRELILKTADPKRRPDALSIAMTVALAFG